MYYFLVKTYYALDEEPFTKLGNFQLYSSDVSPFTGYIVNDEELKRIVDFIESEDDFREYSFFLGMIPPKYQNNIEDFKTDYMDGNYTFEGRHIVEDDE
jgi:hypothetical protein